MRAQAPDVGTDAQRQSGKKLYLEELLAVPRRKRGRRGLRAPHLLPRPRNFTAGKFKVRTTPNGALPTHQDLVNIIRRGMPYTSMPAWPELLRPAGVGSRLFHHDLLARFRRPGKSPQPVAAAQRAGYHERVDRAREEAVRGHRLRQVPRHARARRRTLGADAEGRLGPSDPRGGPRRRAGRSGAARPARTSSGR